jgi:hypothetical protein
VGHVVHSIVSGMQNVNALLSMLMCDRYGFRKKCARTRYAELAFLHPVGSGDHVVHSIASRTQNVHALFFMLWWDRYGFQKKAR